ncbi:MAG: TRAM domain-containing protein [Kofleriaceae bacterium]|nr:TRAM domain-containing protein [Kofleriaceae bacterium]
MTARGPAGAPERVTVRIDALAAGGDGVGRDPTGRAVFVARTAPGDEVVARVVEPHARWARAELVEPHWSTLRSWPPRSCARDPVSGG